VLAGAWQGHAPPGAAVQVIARSGGDIDPTDPAGRLRLMAYVWPDPAGRLQRLRSALDVAAEVPADLRQEPASATLARARVADGSWTVLWHSIVRQYLDPGQRTALEQRSAELGAAATPAARFAHLSLEPAAEFKYLVTLTTWPGGTRRVLGTASPHGIPVTWDRSIAP
jgi:hypothetical protein